jgi:multidrug resistance efflux pump
MSESFDVTITAEWLKEQIKKLEQEQAGANQWFFDAKTKLDRAKADYKLAREFAENTAGVLRGLKEELDIMCRPEEKA